MVDSVTPADPKNPALLQTGDCLDQPTFHRLYEATPEDFRAQLVDGVVYVRGRVTADHGAIHALMTGWAGTYKMNTPGTSTYCGPSLILGPRDEPEPDVVLTIEPAFGGRTTIANRYLAGAPELIVEVVVDESALDLSAKYRAYEAAGVPEYLVVVLDPPGVRWFFLSGGRYEPIAPDGDGILRSRTFPGLWLDPAAVVGDDIRKVIETVRIGLATPDHAAFVTRLAAVSGT